ncbi:hypothetical protein [Nocardioides pocheonensis]|jgi:hypothetical protein|uniref:Uncharacterized protein n=1 Tax=Nocardioides pocheonensis TaxID=661485 RepID=A0A3N0GJW8_9ACTN|nr:hypothetical protein [Nocardioides pocheonensis]RNM12755.1 hypothetical protein EFL26_19425 [Nocardioides pocheonensis]
MTQTATQPVRTRVGTSVPGRLVAVAIIWAASAVIAIGAPDMVSGSQHEHLPIAAITVWLWAAVGSGYASMAPVHDARAWLWAVALVWGATAVATVLAPEMVTGSDPTRIPIVALVAPPVAAVVTGFLALNQAVGEAGSRRRR